VGGWVGGCVNKGCGAEAETQTGKWRMEEETTRQEIAGV
jgi:hypothetical protein